MSTDKSDYNMFLYHVDNNGASEVYICPDKEIVEQKIYVNEEASNMFNIGNVTSISGMRLLDFSLVKNIDRFICGSESRTIYIYDVVFNFRKAESISNLLQYFDGEPVVILPNTTTYSVQLFADSMINGSAIIVDCDAATIRNMFSEYPESILYNCIGMGLFINYTAGHEDGAQALVDLIGGYNNQYNNGVMVGQEVSI